MNSELLKHLEIYYSNIHDHLVLKRMLKERSVLVSLLSIKSNAAFQVLTKARVKSVHVRKIDLDRLLSAGYIRETDVPGYTTITGKGAWAIEAARDQVKPDQLLEIIDRKFFDVFTKGGPLTDKEKVILTSMISVRSFSEHSALDLKKSAQVLIELQSLIISVHRLLKRHGMIGSLTEEKIFGQQGNEHPVSHLIRHTDSLPKKTRGIYRSLGKQKYYLDLYEDTKVSEERLVFLFELITEGSLSVGGKYDLKQFCRENAYKESAFLYDFPKHIFTSPAYDEVVPEALERCFAKCGA